MQEDLDMKVELGEINLYKKGLEEDGEQI